MTFPFTDTFFQSVNQRGYSSVRIGENQMIYPADPVSNMLFDEILIHSLPSH